MSWQALPVLVTVETEHEVTKNFFVSMLQNSLPLRRRCLNLTLHAIRDRQRILTAIADNSLCEHRLIMREAKPRTRRGLDNGLCDHFAVTPDVHLPFTTNEVKADEDVNVKLVVFGLTNRSEPVLLVKDMARGHKLDNDLSHPPEFNNPMNHLLGSGEGCMDERRFLCATSRNKNVQDFNAWMFSWKDSILCFCRKSICKFEDLRHGRLR